MFNDNPDFFPTPKRVIDKMLSKVDFKKGKLLTVLEPSAGSGNLIEAINNKFKYSSYYNSKELYDVDAIEQDSNLIHILKGKNYRVIADDFLNFSTYKQYDLIFMNPPFSNGEKHLIKAINVIEEQSKSGQIVSLLNAETIKNPYTNTRKELIRKLEEYNAQVDFIQAAFVNSERSTSVETALIYINIEKKEYKSVILDQLKKEELHKTTNDYNSTSLIDSDFIKGIVAQYNYEVKAGLKLIDEYNSLKSLMLSSFNDNSNPVLKLDIEYKDDYDSLENAYIKKIRSKYWSTLFSNEQFMSLFTSNLKQKYMEQVNELKDYDFSFYNIYSLRIQLSKEMIQGVEDTILNLFEEFSHKHYYDESSKNVHLYNGWRTNKSYKINKKVIIPLDAYSWFGEYRPTDYKIKDKLKDVEKVFNYLDDGTSEDIDLEECLKMAQHYQETKKIETKYFLITFFKKGTCHIEFKNLDLLQKFNLYAARHKMWLPPSYGKAKYTDMTAEEKEVIDQFEGQQSYNKVMNNASYYIVNSNELLKLTS